LPSFDFFVFSFFCFCWEVFSEMVSGSTHPYLLENYARAPITIVSGAGCELVDDSGKRYLDLVAGIAVCSLGHAHPKITEAIARQAGTLVQCSNLYGHEPAGDLATELAQRSGFARVFFCNSGAEANEAAIKLARKYAFRKDETERRTILSCSGSFHGRTLGALTATANEKYHEGFEPLPGGFRYTNFNDIADLEQTLTEDVAAFIVEPVQGESGVNIATLEYLTRARELCDKNGALLIFDEIQCGMGRLGTLFAFESMGILPDAITMAKALANGLPIGALLVNERCGSALRPGDHGTTFGGSPVPCAAALAHLHVRDELQLDTQVRSSSAMFFSLLGGLVAEYPQLFEKPRGMGLMIGLPVKAPYLASDFVREAMYDGLLINAAGNNTLRFVPPLLISEDQIERAVRIIRDLIPRVVA
jgi:acetylornithine/N-succinyldiaminopimelate aminotransferase